MAQELDGAGGEHTLLWVNCQPVVVQDAEELLEMLQVLFQGGAGDEVVVQVGEDEGKVSKQLVHQALERLRGVGESKRHEEILEQTKRRDNRRFGDVLGGHRYLMVALSKVGIAARW